MPPGGQPGRLFKKNPLRPADFVLNGDIGYKDNIHGLLSPVLLKIVQGIWCCLVSEWAHARTHHASDNLIILFRKL